MLEIQTFIGNFTVETFLKDSIDESAVSIAMVTHLSPEMTKNAIQSFRKHSSVPIEIYLVDNFSPEDVVDELKKIEDINLILNRGEFKSILNGYPDSVLNGVGVDIASRFVNTKYMFVCHNDVLAYSDGWLSYLISKMSDTVKGAAFLRDNTRINAMHVSGYMIDMEVYTSENRNWYPSFDKDRNMIWDVGDHCTQFLRDGGYEMFICPNTHNDPDLLEKIEDKLIDRHEIFADKAISDNGDILYLHLGRGITKFAGMYNKPGRTGYHKWIEFGNEALSSD